MHLALLISSLDAGGAERVLTDLSYYWVSQGHQVTLFTLAAPTAKPFYAVDVRINLIQLNQAQNESSFFKRMGNILKRVVCLRKALRTLKPDVILSFVDMMNVTTLVASAGLKIPVIVSERIDPHFHPIPLLHKKIRAFLYRFAHRVIVQTTNAASYFGNNLQGIIQIIPNPVKSAKDHKIFTFTVQSIITVGRLTKQKGHTTLIHAFTRLHRQYPGIRLTIYGEGAERNNLQALIHSLNLQEKVALPGTIQKIHQKLSEADLFVFPSLYEGFPNALAEAMAVGLPVIASNCSGNVDLVRDPINGRLFPVGDVEKLATLMEELLNDPCQRKRLGEQAQAICTRFHPDDVFKLWDEVIFAAIKQHH